MQKVDVIRPIALSLGNGNSILKPGRHELTDEQMSSWFIPGLIANGSIVIVTEKTRKVKTLNYDTSKITLGEGGVPVSVTTPTPPAKVPTDPDTEKKSDKKEKETTPENLREQER